MVKEARNLLWAVVFTIIVYLYLFYKTAPEQAQAAVTPTATEAIASSDTKTIKSDEDTVVAGKTVRLIDVNEAGSVIVSVGGKLAIVSGSEIIDGIKITIVETFYSADKSSRAATLIITAA